MAGNALGWIYIDSKLPIGLRSAPKIFNAVADAVEWCVHADGVPDVYHYLDDYRCGGSTQLRSLSPVSVHTEKGLPGLGNPLEEGLTTKLTLPGIKIDTVK